MDSENTYTAPTMIWMLLYEFLTNQVGAIEGNLQNVLVWPDYIGDHDPFGDEHVLGFEDFFAVQDYRGKRV